MEQKSKAQKNLVYWKGNVQFNYNITVYNSD